MGTAFYHSIFYSVTEKLANENGRRALLIFSDGEDNSSSHDMMTAIETAQSANVTLFPLRYTEKEYGNMRSVMSGTSARDSCPIAWTMAAVKAASTKTC